MIRMVRPGAALERSLPAVGPLLLPLLALQAGCASLPDRNSMALTAFLRLPLPGVIADLQSALAIDLVPVAAASSPTTAEQVFRPTRPSFIREVRITTGPSSLHSQTLEQRMFRSRVRIRFDGDRCVELSALQRSLGQRAAQIRHTDLHDPSRESPGSYTLHLHNGIARDQWLSYAYRSTITFELDSRRYDCMTSLTVETSTLVQ